MNLAPIAWFRGPTRPALRTCAGRVKEPDPTRVYKGKRGNSYIVRWEVADKERARTHTTKKLAESFRSSLISAARQGFAFDVATGQPEHMTRPLATVTWYEHAMAFVDMKWARASPRHRKSIAEALATVTPALMSTDRGAPSAEMIRHTLYQWAFNTANRNSMPEEGGQGRRLAQDE